MQNKILVVGGSGFIGSNLCARLVVEGCDVTSLDLNSCPTSGVKSIIGNFFDTELLQDLVSESEVVFHALGVLNPGNSPKRYMFGYAEEFAQSVRLFDIAARSGTRVVYLSSGGTVYGKQSKGPIREDVPCEPINHYGALKLCSETAMCVFSEQSGIPMIAARIANPYGPGQDSVGGVGFIDAAIRAFLNDTILEIWGDGSVVRDYLHISNVVEMLIKLTEYDGDHRVFNLSSGIGTSQLEILEILKGLNCVPTTKYLAARSVDMKECVLDNSRIREIYKNPLINLSDGIKSYFESLRSLRRIDPK